ncbi:MAG TPA: metalloregulator ArsR/SmtB family transcription factor [Chthoniobacteraceae bacterium]|jgi:ArsR family transcriptional regulator|nr:metalloregulator ArsR/SmtB family transcription factor [Chthoniobacteraceae bacterium]
MASIVKSLRLLADPTRLRLLHLLQREELTVAEVQEILGMGQSRISSHLSQLKAAQLVRDRRAGKNIFYAMREDFPLRAQIAEIVAAGAREIPETEGDITALQLVLRKRQDRAREYFNRLAGKFGRSYCPGRTWKGVAHLLMALVGPIVVADLGAGEGTLSQMLARHARKVIAIDNSEKMVEFGAALAREHGFANLEYRLGDIEDPPIPAGTVDLVLFSQALHHANNPARALAAAHRLLKRGGRVAVLDLLAHQFEQARELYADTWLGFTEADMHRLLEGAGFADIEVQVVAREEQAPHFQTLFAAGRKN